MNALCWTNILVTMVMYTCHRIDGHCQLTYMKDHISDSSLLSDRKNYYCALFLEAFLINNNLTERASKMKYSTVFIRLQFAFNDTPQLPMQRCMYLFFQNRCFKNVVLFFLLQSYFFKETAFFKILHFPRFQKRLLLRFVTIFVYQKYLVPYYVSADFKKS